MWPFGAPSIRKVLADPSRYSKKTMVSAILKVARDYYSIKQEATLRKIGADPALIPASPAERAARKVAALIANGSVSSEGEVKGKFSRHFDNLLLDYAGADAVRTERVADFFYSSFQPFRLGRKSGKVRGYPQEIREEAFDYAMGAFWRRITVTGFRFEKGASILFLKIFRDQCETERIHRATFKEEQFRNARALGYGQLSPEVVESKLHPPIEMTYHDLEFLRLRHERCWDLVVVEFYLRDQTYAQIADEWGASADDLRKEAYRCRKKFKRTYATLNKLPGDD